VLRIPWPRGGPSSFLSVLLTDQHVQMCGSVLRSQALNQAAFGSHFRAKEVHPSFESARFIRRHAAEQVRLRRFWFDRAAFRNWHGSISQRNTAGCNAGRAKEKGRRGGSAPKAGLSSSARRIFPSGLALVVQFPVRGTAFPRPSASVYHCLLSIVDSLLSPGLPGATRRAVSVPLPDCAPASHENR
jgi:hypothetical protein